MINGLNQVVANWTILEDAWLGLNGLNLKIAKASSTKVVRPVGKDYQCFVDCKASRYRRISMAEPEIECIGIIFEDN